MNKQWEIKLASDPLVEGQALYNWTSDTTNFPTDISDVLESYISKEQTVVHFVDARAKIPPRWIDIVMPIQWTTVPVWPLSIARSMPNNRQVTMRSATCSLRMCRGLRKTRAGSSM